MLTRFRCYLFGCCDDVHCTCQRCGTNLYDDQAAFRQQPCRLVRAWYSLVWRISRITECLTGKYCEVCGKHYWRGEDRYTCSEECGKKWMPF